MTEQRKAIAKIKDRRVIPKESSDFDRFYQKRMENKPAGQCYSIGFLRRVIRSLARFVQEFGDI